MTEAVYLDRAEKSCSVCSTELALGSTTTLDLLRANGYVILDRLLPDDTVDRLCEELDPWHSSSEPPISAIPAEGAKTTGCTP